MAAALMSCGNLDQQRVGRSTQILVHMALVQFNLKHSNVQHHGVSYQKICGTEKWDTKWDAFLPILMSMNEK